MHQENCQLKTTLLDYSTDKLSKLDVFLRFLHPLRQRIALLRSAKLIFVLITFIVSEYDSFCFSLSLCASFWMVFGEQPGAVPPVHAKKKWNKAALFHIQKLFDGF